ncbi:MAG: thioredoxin-like protein [Benjaminiella poitrasii]|nr:MAG: thioredoxin-like protein [Benjaminiella poitrasii]
MKSYFGLVCIGLLALFTFCYANVQQLTDENFSDLVKKEDEWLIDFYADWCGYCKRLEPKFLAADRILAKIENSNVKLGMVNTERNPGLAARFFISRLPTLVHVKDHQGRM